MFLREEGVLATLLGITWRPWGDLGLRAGVLGSSWAALGGPRAAPGTSWRRPGALLGSPGGLLGAPGPRLGRPGGVWEGQGAPQEVPGTLPGDTFGPGWRHPRLSKNVEIVTASRTPPTLSRICRWNGGPASRADRSFPTRGVWSSERFSFLAICFYASPLVASCMPRCFAFTFRPVFFLFFKCFFRVPAAPRCPF